MADKTTQELDNILALLNNIKNTINITRQSLEQAPRGLSAWAADAETLVALQQKYNQLLKEAKQLSAGRGAPTATVSGGHPNQAGYGEAPVEPLGTGMDLRLPAEKAKAEKEALKLAERRLKQEANLEKRLAKISGDSVNEWNRALAAEKKRALSAEKLAAEEKHLADARAKIVNDPRYGQALEQARLRGFDSQHLQGIEDRGGGVQGLTFANREGGINNKFRTYVNEQGKATPGISSQFRSFGSDILRDIGQFTKWSIAVAAVYTPLQKLGELITIMIDNESRLADATIAANVPFEKSGEIFDSVAIAANNAGESINTTIDAYAQAIRAAGRYTSEEEKAQKATSLLSDSLILSKLSTLDQSSAIDTLSAALLQSDRELDQGQELLNKWVRVSQVANVGIDALATGVAVLGDAAETSGLDIDHLNALIAVLSEQSISGSKEAANTAKALIGSYQSDKAETALNKYGFALRKANGEVRGFLEVYQDLAKARKEGVLTESNVSELALALGGGGVRRAKDASALINSQDRLNKLADESASITGDSTLAQDSLAKKLETVQTAVTRLGNAWQELAQTLGDDGGMLDLFKGMINGLTAITKAADDLFTLLGRSGPILATFSTALFALNSIPGNQKKVLLSQLQSSITGSVIGQNGPQNTYGYGGGVGGFARQAAGDVLQLNRRGGTILGGVGVGLAAYSNLQAGKKSNAEANVIGGLIGGAIGASLGGGIGIAAGANIGSAVADSFVTGLTTHSNDLAAYFAGVITPPKPSDGGNGAGPTKEISTEELIKQAYQAIGGGNEIFGSIRAFLAFRGSKGVGPSGITKENTVGSYKNAETAALDILKKVEPELYARIQARFEAKQASEAPVTTNPVILQLQKQAEAERGRQLQRVSSGDLRPSEFGKISERLAGFPKTAKQDVEAFGDSFIAVSKDIDTTSEAYNALLELVVNGTDEQQAQIASYVSDIQKMKAEYENWQPTTKDLTLDLTVGTKTFSTKEQLGKALKDAQQQAGTFTTGAIADIRFQQLRQPPIVGDFNKPDTQRNVNLNVQKGLEIQGQYQEYLKSMGATADQIDKLNSKIEPFAVAVEKGTGSIFQSVNGLGQNFYELGQKANEAAGALDEIQKIGFQKFDVPMSQLQQLAAQSLNIGQNWSDQYNYDFKPEDQIAIDNQGIVQPLHADFKILALLLEKLNEKAQKQLDGQYNIPEGATFWVPLTAAYYRNKGTDTGGLDTSSLDSSANNLDGSANALNAAAQALRDSAYWKSEKFGAPVETYDPAKDPNSTYWKSEKFGAPIPPANPVPGGLATPYDVTKTESTSMQSGMAQLFAELRSFLQGLVTSPGRNVTGGNLGAGTVGGSIKDRSAGAAPVSSSTKLDLKISSNINLQVDGRILASTLQNYLASELLRTEQSQGTITKRFVI